MSFLSNRFSLLFACVALLGSVRGLHAETALAAGADTVWTTHMATNADGWRGEWLASFAHGDIANESVARRCLRLSNDGDFVEWRVQRPANALVLRYSIPDAPAGGGLRSTLTLVINGQVRQQLPLDSRHAWLYGPRENGQDNDPAAGGVPHRFFDDVRALILGAPLQAGDIVRLEKKDAEGNNAFWYAIDLIDLERVEPPSAPPDGALSILDYGAVPDDDRDDTVAIETAIARAREQAASVWIPAGTFLQSRQILLPGVRLSGAGPWHTRLVPTGPATESMGFPGNAGFRLAGNGAQVRDLMIEGNTIARSRPRQHGFSSETGCRGFLIENVWIEHVKTGMWLGSCSDGTIRRVRVRNTYADGINLNNTAVSVTIEQSHFRNTGDDAMAAFSNGGGRGAEGPCRDIIFRHNTIEAPWWAHGIGIYGGTNITLSHNLIRGASRAPGIKLAASAFHGKNDWPGENILLTGNSLIDCGGTSWKQSWGALWFYTTTGALNGVLVEKNEIIRPVNDAIKIQGGSGAIDATFIDNRIIAPRSAVLQIASNARGRLSFPPGNIVSDFPEGIQKIINRAPAENFILTETQ